VAGAGDGHREGVQRAFDEHRGGAGGDGLTLFDQSEERFALPEDRSGGSVEVLPSVSRMGRTSRSQYRSIHPVRPIKVRPAASSVCELNPLLVRNLVMAFQSPGA
jgi:hypothetical protein